ncbi:MAG TPA: hypothetical protein VNF29_14570 [Candidatus Binataceae bacterium]|nr:hypothetical protein [Candidatus Binataceae bacterium]
MAFYADKDYTTDQTVFEAVNQVMSGNLTLFWYDAKTEKVKGRPADPRRGLTYQDLDLGSYGYTAIPENVRTSQSMVARGSEKWGNLPDMGYVVNRKSDVWSENVTVLYEEDKTRRWTPAIDIPWSELETHPLPAPLEAACAQLYTFLQECALVSMDFAARWVPLVNQDFIEQKSWLCAQMFNWARMNEAFRKRALYGGAGLGRASASGEQGLKEWLWADSFPKGSISINLSLGGLVLAICRHVAAFAPSKPDRALMGYAMQDCARQTAYGLGQLRYHLAHRPGELSAIGEYVAESEHVMLALLGSPELLEPLIIIAGGGLEKEQVNSGRAAVAKFMRLATREYFERLEAAGLKGSRARSRLTPLIERIGAAA